MNTAALIVYVCLNAAGEREFRDTPCVERPSSVEPAVGTIREWPRVPEEWEVPVGPNQWRATNLPWYGYKGWHYRYHGSRPAYYRGRR